MLRRGQEYDLATRKVIQFDDRNFINLTTSVLEKYCGDYRRIRDGNILNISIRDNELFVEQWNDYSYSIKAESEKMFYASRFNLSMEFRMSGQEVIGFDVLTHGDRFEKIE